MGLLDIFFHLANLLALPIGVALIAASLARLFGAKEVRATSFGRLAVWSSMAAVLAVLGGLVLEGRDGRMLTHGAMVGLVALALVWAPRKR